ncbi:MAG TPA: class I fructose-bisphosphate aldolase [Candidatus Paceibacterota bacterium]
MTEEFLAQTAKRLTSPPKGILAIDESLSTCNKRFEPLGVPTTIEKRQEYRELLITTPGIEDYISGYILFDETIRQSALDGRSFTSIMKEKGLDIGIKVDEGPVEFPDHPGEKITKGLIGLDARLKEYKAMGATFAKWRAVYTITDTTPSEVCMKANAQIFVKYVQACQDNDIVPLVEPEVLMNGNHLIEKCYEVTARNLQIVFDELKAAQVFLPGIILKTNMVLPGQGADITVDHAEIARMTIKCLKEKVPEEIGGIVFLSGGQKDEEATMRLQEMHKLGSLPWPLTFSYGRAIQDHALESWAANPDDITTAQDALLFAARNDSLATLGQYKGEAHLGKGQ